MTQPVITGNNSVNVNVTAPSTNSAQIINSGASDHMTKDPSEIQSLKPSSQPFISTVTSGTSPVIGEGPVVLTYALSLDTVLVVPTLSVSRVTSSYNCTITFWPPFCNFQDILTRRTLGFGVKRHNLYFLELTKGGEKKFSHAFRTYVVEKARENVWL